MRTRKARIDSASEAVRVMSKAASGIVPPPSVFLEKCDMPFFASVIAEFARSEWTAHQLELAAMLARTMADLNREQMALRKEGAVMTEGRQEGGGRTSANTAPVMNQLASDPGQRRGRNSPSGLAARRASDHSSNSSGVAIVIRQ